MRPIDEIKKNHRLMIVREGKDIFWDEEECVVQFHPPRSQYVDTHPYCLHLWKKIGETYETPPKEFV